MLINNFISLIASAFYYGFGWLKASLQGVKLSPGARISPHANVRKAAFIGNAVIGRNVVLGRGTYINSGTIASATIGDYCSIAYGVMIGPTEHKVDYWTTSPYEAIDNGFLEDAVIEKINNPVIGDGVWIGAHSIILKGVKINNGAVIAAGAVVVSDIPSNEVWGGVPARFLRKRVI